MNHLSINHLLQQIVKTDEKKVSQPELSCITQLVYYSGIRQKEIVDLRVLDVVDANGDVKTVIRNKIIITDKEPIIFPDQARNVIGAYLAIMESKNPILVMKRKPLFPTYRTDRTLRRHWEKIHIKFSEIREGGIKSHFTRESLNHDVLEKIYKEGSKIYRISPRQFYAVIANKKIQSGQIVYDDRCIVRMLEAWEQIQKINCNSPSAKNDAIKILDEANEAFGKIRNPEHRNNYESLIDHISNIANSI
jgi:site-specific recombinase XerD